MNEIVAAALSFVAGGLLGVFFFGGLFWTVTRAVVSPSPAVWFIGSFLVRTIGTMAGFYFASDGQWQRMLICLAGFWLARSIVEYLMRIRTARAQSEEVHRAS